MYSSFRINRKNNKKKDMIINILITIVGIAVILTSWFVKDNAAKSCILVVLFGVLMLSIFGIIISKDKL